MSFTKDKDSSTHFSQYVNKGKGVYIGFDPNCIEEYMTSMALYEEFGDFIKFQDVIYDVEDLNVKID